MAFAAPGRALASAAVVLLVAATAAARPAVVERPLAALHALPPAVELPAVARAPLDRAEIRAEDAWREEAGLPPRFALPDPVRLDPQNAGTWQDAGPDHLLWRLRITVPGAKSLNLGFGTCVLGPQAVLAIHAADAGSAADARGFFTFTAADNDPHGELWTPVVLADDIVVELRVPRGARDATALVLTSINKGYRLFGTERSPDKAGSCNVDVVCPEGDDWRAEINSVGAISSGGSIYCTGVLLNNTAEDGTPYFLTADHCGITAAGAPSLVVYWNFQSPTCGQQGGGSLADFQTGSTLLATSATTDFTLLLLDDPVDPLHQPSWAGWDNSGAVPTRATGIHHPSGDEKSISHELDPLRITSYGGGTSPGDGTHLQVVDWDVGTTETISSGSPLFDQDGRVVGQLHGGLAACGNDSPDWYGRFSLSWPALAAWLDPLGSGAVTLDTRAPWYTGIRVRGDDFAAVGDPGGPFTPAQTGWTVVNNGSDPVNWQASANVAWLDVAPSGGILAGNTEVTVTGTLNAVADIIPVGNYSGSVSFVNLDDGGGSTTRDVVLDVGLPETITLFDLETDPGWSRDGAWEWGPATAGGDTVHGNPDPGTAASGTHVFGYALGGDYGPGMAPTHLVTTALDCSRLADTSVRFKRWLNVEEPRYDTAALAVSADGVNFTTVWSNPFTITDDAWIEVEYDISAVADRQPTVYLRWTLGPTDGSWQFSGWNIDDVEIRGVVLPLSDVPDVRAAGLAIANHPNPFNPATQVTYVLPRAGRARIGVYDLRGRLVRELLDGDLPAGPGHVTWGGTDTAGHRVPSGVYLARVVAAGEIARHKMMLVK